MSGIQAIMDYLESAKAGAELLGKREALKYILKAIQVLQRGE